MKKISADLVFPIASEPIERGVVVIDDTGLIHDVLDSVDGLDDVEFHEGILCPGFVNTHCHLELSHLRGKIKKGNGMVGFIREVKKQKEMSIELIQEGLNRSEQELINNGVVAVGDICNTADSFKIKTKKRLHYHNFLEVFSIVPQQAGEVFSRAITLHRLAMEVGLSASIVPHAPYTCSSELMKLIDNFPGNNGQPFTIHNQESMSEDELFRSGQGALAGFYKELGIDISFFNPTGTSSLEWLLPLLPAKQKILLVHNTFTSSNDLKAALASHADLYWCLCPNANLYIEGKTPDGTLFPNLTDKVTIGTDSLASNDNLSILEEMKILQEVMPSVSLDILLQWGTLNGARLLGLDSNIGTLEKGKKPGLNLIVGADIEKRRFKAEALVTPLF